ncbi:MAG: InlB B-repeat-containing protein [Anaeroplasma sp.]
MRKKIFISFFVMVLAFVFGLGLTSCKKDTSHKHSYATAWNNDASNHWHECAATDCNEKSDLAAHTWEEVVTKPATDEEAGEKTYTCTVCGYSKKESYVLHTFANEWSKDETNHWHACTIDGCTYKGALAAHTWKEEITKPATDEEAGEKTYTCTVCGYSKKESYVLHTFANEWSKDETNHWHACTIDGCTYKGALAAHTWEEEIINNPTYDNDGTKKFTCTVCGYEKTESIPALGYTITFDSKGGSEVEAINKKSNETISAPSVPTKEGCEFLGWYTSNDPIATATKFEFTTMPAQNITLYAKWAIVLSLNYKGLETNYSYSFNVTNEDEEIIFTYVQEKGAYNEATEKYVTYVWYNIEKDNNGTYSGAYHDIKKNDESNPIAALYSGDNWTKVADDLTCQSQNQIYFYQLYQGPNTYYFVATFANTGTYRISTDVFSWKEIPTLSFSEGLDLTKTYDKEAVTILESNYSTNSDGEVSVIWYDYTKTKLEGAPVDASGYYVRLYVPETEQYREKYSDYLHFEIKYININIGDVELEYNGDTSFYFTYTNEDYENILADDEVNFYVTFESKNVGSCVDDYDTTTKNYWVDYESCNIVAKELTNLQLTTTSKWEENQYTTIKLTTLDGLIEGDNVSVCITNGNYQDADVGSVFTLKLDTAYQGEEIVELLLIDDYSNYKLVEIDGEVGTIEIVPIVISNITFSASAAEVSGFSYKFVLTTAYGIEDGDEVIVTIVSNVVGTKIILSSSNTTITGADASRYVIDYDTCFLNNRLLIS